LRVGKRIFDAIAATRATVACNTNLGIVLLAAPLAHAALLPANTDDLRIRLEAVLSDLDVTDAELTYQAIRQAAPGGLGRSERHDVESSPQVTLLQAMAEAQDRDAIARAYVTGYLDVFALGVPLAQAALARWNSEEWAMVAVFLGFLARFPDTHVQRKFGRDTALSVSREAAKIETQFQLASHPADCLQQLGQFDQSLKRAGINPGTSADLSVATFLAMRVQNLLEQRVSGHANGHHPQRTKPCKAARVFQQAS
jgi:triphosphoribosyl-dephospho-CoA synthase